ncbi:dienelactone hydrolase [Sulfitobacter albidus]|uniref:Dienelactone hydrolase n=1 Tax=Sulfitobacter albidus TaxID=2829501 RepID=A0A975JGK5_9RHOB|nr:dienelactone hydrolase [Sulfitobacter albidus]QUJ77875.1 dienelactone hydrolase [Sulfitobacter albidus]
MTFAKISSLPLAVLATGTMALANPIDTQLPNAPELAAYGDLPVGVRTVEMVNPDQINILAIDPAADKPAEMPRYDRPLTVEVWYPAVADAVGETDYRAFLRDGTTEVTLTGRAMRDAAPAEAGESAYPLVLISHGYPGNRFLLAHLAENLASKGYVVASIDHTDSTYRTQAAFGSTLVNRSLDQLFVLEEMAKLSQEGDLAGLFDAENTGLIGYSMGGYGAVITAGGGVTEASVGYPWGAPHGTLGIHQAGSETHEALPDDRIKTIVAFGPWGMNTGFWDAEGLSGVQVPAFYIAGSQDDVSLYENGVRAMWENTSSVESALLTYVNGGHNAGAPMPAPAESYYFNEDKGFDISEHYTDPVWNTARMNNIAQHFVTAWLDEQLKGEAEKGAYFDLVENSNDGVWSVNDDGSEKEDHSHWKGFAQGTAKGLMFEVKTPE